MNLSITIFYFVLKQLTEEEIDLYNKKMDSFIRNMICQGFFVRNFQDKIFWS